MKLTVDCMKLKSLALSLCFLSIFFPTAFAQETGEGPKLRLSTPDEIQAEFNSVPCKNGDRQAAVKALFEKMGAKPEEIKVEKSWGVENVVVRRPGANGAAEKIVIGAHYDKVADGCGALDNWTGIVAIAHIYRTLKEVPHKKNFVFVAFGQEEKGLVGSSGMAADIKKEQLPEYCAMINIDSLGLGMPQAADNMSNPRLVNFVEGLAKEVNIPFAHGAITGGDSDSTPFNRRKIPALTIHAMTKDWPKILHSSKDQSSTVNSQSVYAGYRLSLVLLARLDEADCQAFREGKEKK
jgi:hypothetical protein